MAAATMPARFRIGLPSRPTVKTWCSNSLPRAVRPAERPSVRRSCRSRPAGRYRVHSSGSARREPARRSPSSAHDEYVVLHETVLAALDLHHLADALDMIQPRILLGGRLHGWRSDEVDILRGQGIALRETVRRLLGLTDHSVVGDVDEGSVVGLERATHVQPQAAARHDP